LDTLIVASVQRPNLRTPNPRFNPGLTPLLFDMQGVNPGFNPFYITNAWGEPRVKPGVWRPEMWAQVYFLYLSIAP
jgi:hypothetical protein